MGTIERLGPDDWQEFREIRLRALADAPTAFGMTLADAEQQHGGHLARPGSTRATRSSAVRDGDRLVAMGAGWHPPEDPDRMMVWGMWTAPEARGRGHARALLGWLVEHARRARGHHRRAARHRRQRHRPPALRGQGFVATGEWTPLREGSDLRIELLRAARRLVTRPAQNPSLRSWRGSRCQSLAILTCRSR